MNNVNLIKHLENLSHDRFALSVLSDDEFSDFHKQFLKNFYEKTNSYKKITHSDPAHDWYLIGTDGCHLCQISHQLITQTSTIYPNIPAVHVLDVIDGDDVMIDTAGKLIPLLLTPNKLLCYPFGVMDIIGLTA